MSFKKILPAVMIPLLFLLSSCGGGGTAGGTTGGASAEGDLIGRWEHYATEARTEGTAYEFFDDGSLVSYVFLSANQAPYPGKFDSYNYVYSTSDATLTLSAQWRGGAEARATESAPTDIVYQVTFVSADEMILKGEGEAEGLTFLRTATPEIPFEARTLLGKRIRRENLEVVKVERVEGNWQDLYPGYVEIYRDHFIEIEDPEQWAVFVQAPGEGTPRIFLLVEGTTRWGVIQLQNIG